MFRSAEQAVKYSLNGDYVKYEEVTSQSLYSALSWLQLSPFQIKLIWSVGFYFGLKSNKNRNLQSFVPFSLHHSLFLILQFKEYQVHFLPFFFKYLPRIHKS